MSHDSRKTFLADLEKAGAPRRTVKGATVEMMLAEIRDRAFSSPEWVFEVKLDGYRLLVERAGDSVHVISRNGNELRESFPEIAGAAADLPFEHIVLDGEVVALDEKGRPSFQRLQQRGKLTRAPDVKRASGHLPVIFFAFDLLAVDGFDLRPLPLMVRKAFLARVVSDKGLIRYLDSFSDDGETLFRNVVGMGLEGIVAKRADSTYKGGRSSHWLKIRADRTDDFVVVGFTEPKGSRHGFGALHLGQYVAGNLVYAGRAGTGFNARQLTEVRSRLDALLRKTPPCTGPVPPGASSGALPLSAVPDYRTATWVEPRLVCEVRFKEWTDEGYLRQPAFLRFRDDKNPSECVRQLTPAETMSVAANPTAAIMASAKPRSPKAPARKAVKPGGIKPALKLVKSSPAESPSRVPFTNLDKVLWPEDGYTKGDLIDYYRSIAPWLLPYLDERPVVLTRYPDGIQGKSFFQKDAPSYAPAWLRTERMWSAHAERDIDYFMVDHVDSLLYLANMAAIPLHIWASRAVTLTHPDWCSLDLDPKGAPFSDVVEVAQAARDLCRRLALPSYIKTTGSSGLHVMMPLGRQCSHDQARSFAEVLAQVIVKQLPSIATTTRAVEKREGKVYVDYLQNGHGKLLVAPYSVRPLPGAPVSMPLQWKEITPSLDIRSFTIKNAVDRMKKLKRDPLVDIIDMVPDLGPVLEALHGEL